MNVGEDDVRIFNDSLDRCVADPRFMDLFYDHFVGSSEAVARLFAATHMDKQKRLLKASLYTSVLAADGNEAALEDLERLGRRHRQLGVGPRLYDLWLECLLGAVEECGGFLDVRTEEVWRRVLAGSVSVLKGSEEKE